MGDERYLGESTPKLGFGFMRLPKLEDGAIDIEQTKDMVDRFMDAGLTYFDTAYVYDNGGSERALKEALVDRYPARRSPSPPRSTPTSRHRRKMRAISSR